MFDAKNMRNLIMQRNLKNAPLQKIPLNIWINFSALILLNAATKVGMFIAKSSYSFLLGSMHTTGNWHLLILCITFILSVSTPTHHRRLRPQQQYHQHHQQQSSNNVTRMVCVWVLLYMRRAKCAVTRPHHHTHHMPCSVPCALADAIDCAAAAAVHMLWRFIVGCVILMF